MRVCEGRFFAAEDAEDAEDAGNWGDDWGNLFFFDIGRFFNLTSCLT